MSEVISVCGFDLGTLRLLLSRLGASSTFHTEAAVKSQAVTLFCYLQNLHSLQFSLHLGASSANAAAAQRLRHLPALRSSLPPLRPKSSTPPSPARVLPRARSREGPGGEPGCILVGRAASL